MQYYIFFGNRVMQVNIVFTLCFYLSTNIVTKTNKNRSNITIAQMTCVVYQNQKLTKQKIKIQQLSSNHARYYPLFFYFFSFS